MNFKPVGKTRSVTVFCGPNKVLKKRTVHSEQDFWIKNCGIWRNDLQKCQYHGPPVIITMTSIEIGCFRRRFAKIGVFTSGHYGLVNFVPESTPFFCGEFCWGDLQKSVIFVLEITDVLKQYTFNLILKLVSLGSPTVLWGECFPDVMTNTCARPHLTDTIST